MKGKLSKQKEKEMTDRLLNYLLGGIYVRGANLTPVKNDIHEFIEAYKEIRTRIMVGSHTEQQLHWCLSAFVLIPWLLLLYGYPLKIVFGRVNVLPKGWIRVDRNENPFEHITTKLRETWKSDSNKLRENLNSKTLEYLSEKLKINERQIHRFKKPNLGVPTLKSIRKLFNEVRDKKPETRILEADAVFGRIIYYLFEEAKQAFGEERARELFEYFFLLHEILSTDPNKLDKSDRRCYHLTMFALSPYIGHLSHFLIPKMLKKPRKGDPLSIQWALESAFKLCGDSKQLVGLPSDQAKLESLLVAALPEFILMVDFMSSALRHPDLNGLS